MAPSAVRSEPGSSGDPRSRLVTWALLLLLATTFGLRAWYAVDDPRPGRFWDERYSLLNVRALLGEGGEWPAKAFYPSLSYLPQVAVLGPLHLACDEWQLCSAHVVREEAMKGGGTRVVFTPLAYRLCRLLPALFGTLCVLWLFRIARHLVPPETALLAAAFLAAVPAHLRMSGIFKPDMLMGWLLLVAVEAALRVALQPSLRRYLWAGLAVGLAASAKYNGVAAAVPLAVGTGWAWLSARRRDGGPASPATPQRRLGWLVWAGVASVLTFLALNPHVFTHPEIFIGDHWNTVREYAWRGEQAGAGRAALLPRFAASLPTPFFHGALVGTLALVGLPLFLAAAFSGRWAGTAPDGSASRSASGGGSQAHLARRERWAVVAAAPVGYLALYIVSTTNPSAHSWLPLVPFTSLGAAWLVWRSWRLIAPRLPQAFVAPLAAAVLGAALLAVPVRAGGWVYHLVVPSTATLAEEVLVRELPRHLRHRLVIYDGEQRMRVKRGGGNKAILVHRDDLFGGGLPSTASDLPEGAAADAVISRAPAGVPLPPCTAPPGRLAPSPFIAWGGPLSVVAHPWRRAGEVRDLVSGGSGFAVPAIDLPPAGRVSFEILPGPGVAAEELRPVRLGARELAVFWGETGHRRFRLLSERVALPEGAAPAFLTLGGGASPSAVVRVLPWLPPTPCR